jgi:hypothetical protein
MRARIVTALSMASLLVAPCAVSAAGPFHPDQGGREFRVPSDRMTPLPPFGVRRHFGRRVFPIVPAYPPDYVVDEPSDDVVILPRAPVPPPPPAPPAPAAAAKILEPPAPTAPASDGSHRVIVQHGSTIEVQSFPAGR